MYKEIMTELLNRLEACGVDVSEGVERLMKSESMYIKYLGMFLEDTNMQELEEAYAKGDISEMFLKAHALKSLSGNLSLTCIYERLKIIVEILRKQDMPQDAQMQELFLDYRKIKDAYYRN